MAPKVSPVYFTDENTLGLGKLLRRGGRDDVRYPGHEELPQIPRGADDQDWLPIVGALGFIVLSRDRRIRTRPAELRAYYEHGVRSVWIGAKQDLGPEQQLEIFLRYEERLRREIVKRGPGPWAVAMTPSGVRPQQLRPNPGEKPIRW
ncbi:MAG: hypothetical protein K0U84_07280 [Actinomycetia bacterium]|nr:hypothetical protein [Actinomycetes bacterium]